MYAATLIHAARLGSRVLMAAAVVSLLAFGLRTQAQEDTARTAKGVVQRFTTAPKGERDGCVLDDGTVVHWPPHLEQKVTNGVSRGDRIRVSGRNETTPEGDTHLEAQKIDNLTRGTSVELDAAPPPPATPAPPPPLDSPRGRPGRDIESRTAKGTVDRFTTARRGEIDGCVLDDGTVVHWPPHLQRGFRDAINKGDRIEVVGRMETGPEGDAHLEVIRLTNLRTRATVSNDDGPPNAAPPRAGDREQRLRNLEEQVEQLQREIQRLRRDQ